MRHDEVIKGTTNKSKLVRWDADYYKELTDEDCIICLTERQVYLVGQIMEQITWYNTRWIGDKSGLDFDEISANLEYRISERMTCQNLTLLLEKVTQLEEKINIIFQETQENEGNPIFNINTTTVNSVTPVATLTENGVSSATCDDAGKDGVYSAVNTVVRYIIQNNTDFLERLAQSFSVSENAARLISAIPIIGLFPVDEAFDYAAFLANELLDEYNAIVDETLIQTVVCDLFCISVANNCTLDFNDVYSYFARKVAPTFNNAVSTFANLVQFGITGTFSGDDYFYYMCYLQLVTVGMGEFFLSLNSIEPYGLKARDGLNSPNNGWETYCTSCPTFTHWVYDWDFAWGLGEFLMIEGTLESGMVKSIDIGAFRRCYVILNSEVEYDIEKIAASHISNGHIGNGSHDVQRHSVFPDINQGGAETVLYVQSFITTNDVELEFCVDSDVTPNASQCVRVLASCSEALGAGSYVGIKRVKIIGADNGNGKPVLAYWVESEPPCSEF